jgi:hypothetical protein
VKNPATVLLGRDVENQSAALPARIRCAPVFQTWLGVLRHSSASGFLSFLGIAVLSILSSGCSINTAGGDSNTSETQNVYYIRFTQDDQPVAALQVSFIDTLHWKDSVLNGRSPAEQLKTTSDEGLILIDSVEIENYSLVAQNDSHDAFLHRINPDSDTINVELSPMVPYRGNVYQTDLATANNANGTNRLCLSYSPFCAILDEDGNFHFENIPQASYQLALPFEDLGLVNLLSAWNLNSETSPRFDSVYAAPEKFVLEDFDDGDGLGKMAAWNNRNWWWVFQVQSDQTPSGLSDLPDYIVAEEGNAENLVLDFKINFAPDSTYPLYLLGLNAGAGILATDSQNVFVDLSQMDSLQIRYKASDSLLVFFQSKTVLELGDEQHLHYRLYSTDNEWKTVTLYPESFKLFTNSLAEEAQLTYEEISNRVSSLVFQIRRSGQYGIDEITIYGLSDIRLYDWDE